MVKKKTIDASTKVGFHVELLCIDLQNKKPNKPF
jgi:hypothetical protein